MARGRPGPLPQPTNLPLLPTAKNLINGLDRLPTVAQLAVPAEARAHLEEVVSIAQWAAQEKLQDGGAHGAAAGRLAAQLAALNTRLEEIVAAKQLPSGCLPFTWSQALKRKDSGGKESGSKAPARLFPTKGSFKLGKKDKAPSQFETLMADIRAAYDAAEVYRSEVKAALAEAAKARYSSPAQRILLMQQESEAPGLGHAVATLEINRRKAGGLWPEGLFAEQGGDSLEHVLAHREALAAFWDRFAEGTASGAIDDAWWSSPSGRRWLERGRDYRLLCEPLDIVAHYYAQRTQHAQQGGKEAAASEVEEEEGAAEEEGQQQQQQQQQPAAVVVHYCEDALDGLKDPNGARPRRHIMLQQLEKRILRGRPEPSLAKARALADCGGDVFALPGMPALVAAARAAAAEAAAAAALAASAGAAAAASPAESKTQSPAGGKAGAAAAAAAAAAGKKEEEGAKPMPWPLPSFVPPTPPQHERGLPPGGRRNGGDQGSRKGARAAAGGAACGGCSCRQFWLRQLLLVPRKHSRHGGKVAPLHRRMPPFQTAAPAGCADLVS